MAKHRNRQRTEHFQKEEARGSVLRILLVSMLGFGIFIGLIFPPFAKVVLDAPDALSPRFMLMCITAGLIVGIVNFLLFKIFVSRELEYLARGMELVNRKIGEGVSGGNYLASETQLDVRSEDIIGDVVLAFNKMSKTIVSRFNRDQLFRDLVSRLANSTDLHDSSQIILQGFMEATGAFGGILYARVNGRMEPQATVGLDKSEDLPDTALESQGVVDKAVQTGQVVDIDPDLDGFIWITMSTPLGKLKPEAVKVVPLQIEKNTIGLVILVSRVKKVPESARKVEDLRTSLTPYLENVILYQKIKKLAARDSLTGIYNRRFGEQRLSESFSLCQRKNLPLNILMLDIDHFKQINDSYGHTAGDLVLKELAKYLENHLRQEEIVCRYGGEEFLIIMPYTEVKEAIKLACRLRRGIESDLEITVSMGVANWPTIQTSNIDTLINAADDALYYAKKKGRNVVACNEGGKSGLTLVSEEDI